MAYLALFFAGAFLCNAIPHLGMGLIGRRFYTPWSWRTGNGMASAIENVIWGSANLAVGAFLVDRVYWNNVPHGLIVLATGFVIAGCGIARTFERRAA